MTMWNSIKLAFNCRPQNYHPTHGLKVRYYGVGTYFDAVNESDITELETIHPSTDVYRLSEPDSITLEVWGDVITSVLYPLSRSDRARGELMFVLPTPCKFTRADATGMVNSVNKTDNAIELFSKYYGGANIDDITKWNKGAVLHTEHHIINNPIMPNDVMEDYKLGLVAGESLEWSLAEQLCKSNNWGLDSGNFYIAQNQYRKTIEDAWHCKEIQSRCRFTYLPLPVKGIFEDAFFVVGDLEKLLNDKLGFYTKLDFLLGIKQDNEDVEQQAESAGGNEPVLTPPSNRKIKEHEKRNNDYITYLKETIPHIDDKPEPHTFDFRRKFLQDELIKRYGQKWLYDFDKWNKQRPFKDIVRLKRGR